MTAMPGVLSITSKLLQLLLHYFQSITTTPVSTTITRYLSLNCNWGIHYSLASAQSVIISLVRL